MWLRGITHCGVCRWYKSGIQSKGLLIPSSGLSVSPADNKTILLWTLPALLIRGCYSCFSGIHWPIGRQVPIRTQSKNLLSGFSSPMGYIKSGCPWEQAWDSVLRLEGSSPGGSSFPKGLMMWLLEWESQVINQGFLLGPFSPRCWLTQPQATSEPQALGNSK